MIEVGDWIRTNRGHIGKLKRIELDKNDKGLKWFVFDHKEFDINIIKEEYINKPYITKYSKNLVDIIEIGDYVNGKKIDAIIDGVWKSEGVGEKVLCFEIDFPIEKGLRAFHDCDIQDIVTHEQFEQIKYKVKEV